MSAETIGAWSGALVFASVVPYAVRTYECKVHPVPTSWALWSLLGLAILLTYRSSGAGANIWPAVFGFVNPTVITILSVARHGRWKRPSVAERWCLVLGMVSLGMWFFLRGDADLAAYALYVAIVADLCAAVPTLLFVWAEPQRDRPFAWVLFAFGYLLAVFAIPRNTIGNWILPLYMTVIALAVAFPLIVYRVRTKVPLRHWL